MDADAAIAEKKMKERKNSPIFSPALAWIPSGGMFEVLSQSKALALSPALISFVLHISVGTYDDLLSC